MHFEIQTSRVFTCLSILVLNNCVHSQIHWEQAGLTAVRPITVLESFDGFVFAASDGTIFRSVDEGKTWQEITQGLNGQLVTSLAVDTYGNLYAGMQCPGDNPAGVFRSTNKGNTWARISPNDYCVTSVAANSKGDLFISATIIHKGIRGIFRSRDSGATWEPTLFSNWAHAIVVNQNDDILAGVYDEGVFRSSDDGHTWSKSNKGLTNTAIISMAINSEGHIFVSTGQQQNTLPAVFRSTNDGGSWKKLDLNLLQGANGEPLTVRSLAVGLEGEIYAATDGIGILVSRDNGDTWIEQNRGLTHLNVTAVTVAKSGRVRIGTAEGGVYRSRSSIDSDEPRHFRLFQNFPNPFNSSTKIYFDVPTERKVNIKIYNILGQKIKTMVDETKAPGFYSVFWDGTDVHGQPMPSGVYFYRFDAGVVSGTKKMILMR